MRVYIAYKYRSIEDKDGLRKDLESISNAVEGLSYKPFVLGRDVQKWHSSSSSVFKTIPHILINLAKSDIVLAYVSSDVKSWGLPFELHFAKVFDKPVIVAKKVGVTFNPGNAKIKKVIEFIDVNDLTTQISLSGL